MMNAVEVDNWERSIDACIRFGGASCDRVNVGDFAPVALSLVRDPTGTERLQIIRRKVLRVHNIKTGWDMPDPPPLFTDALIRRIGEFYDEKEKRFDKPAIGDAISGEIRFLVPPSGEFLYYDPGTGAWKSEDPTADHIIHDILRRAFPDISRFMRDEITTYVRETHLAYEPLQSASNAVNLQNCAFSLADFTPLPHSPDFGFNYVIPVRFDPQATCPAIFEFLEQVFKDDLNKALKALEFYAYSLLDGYPIQKAMVALGNGNNGKSVYLAVLSALLGPGNIQSISLQAMSYSPFAKKELKGKLANIAGDVQGGMLKDTSAFKLLTSGLDTIDGEEKFVQKRKPFRNRAKLYFGFNQLPITLDQTDAFYRRFEFIKFLQTFENPDEHIMTRIGSQEELSGLLNVLLFVFVPGLGKGKFHDSMTIESLRLEYNLSADPGLAFIAEHVTSNMEEQVLTEFLYGKMVDFCKSKRLNIPSAESFGYALINRSGMFVQKRKVQDGGVQKNYYQHIEYHEDVELKASDREPKPAKFNNDSLRVATVDYIQCYIPALELKLHRLHRFFHAHACTRDPCVSCFDKAMQPEQPIQKNIPDDIKDKLEPPNERIYRNYKVVKEFTSQGLHYNVGYEFKPYDSPEVRSWLSDGKIMQIPDDSGEVPASEDLRIYQEQMRSEGLTFVAILKDHPPIAWDGGNFYLHANDMISLPSRLAELLIGRGAAREVQP